MWMSSIVAVASKPRKLGVALDVLRDGEAVLFLARELSKM